MMLRHVVSDAINCAALLVAFYAGVEMSFWALIAAFAVGLAGAVRRDFE